MNPTEKLSKKINLSKTPMKRKRMANLQEGFKHEIKKHAVDLPTLGAIIGIVLGHKKPKETKKILEKLIGSRGAKYIPAVAAGGAGGYISGKILKAMGKENRLPSDIGREVQTVRNVYGDPNYDPRFQ